MPLIIEAIYLVAPVDVLASRLLGGAETFRNLVPNTTHATDGELAGCGFMSPSDAYRFASFLAKHGLRFDPEDPDSDLTLVDMRQGVIGRSSRVISERVPYPGHPTVRVRVARLAGGQVKDLVGFDGWNPEESMNRTLDNNGMPSLEELEFLGRIDGKDTYRNKVTGKLYYAGRS
jgi:hypothetical protein